MADTIYIRNTRTGKAAPVAQEAAFRGDNPDGNFVYFDTTTGLVVPSPDNAASAVNQVEPAPRPPAPPAPAPAKVEAPDDTVVMSQAEIDEVVHGDKPPAPDHKPAAPSEKPKRKGWLG